MSNDAMMHAAEFRRCLLDLDYVAVRQLWQHVCPHLPQPRDDDEALYMLHVARTKAESIPQSKRLYSKQWIAERDRRRIAASVGVSVKASSSWRKVQAQDLQAHLSDVVLDAHKEGVDLDHEAPEVRRRLNQARDRIRNRVLVSLSF